MYPYQSVPCLNRFQGFGIHSFDKQNRFFFKNRASAFACLLGSLLSDLPQCAGHFGGILTSAPAAAAGAPVIGSNTADARCVDLRTSVL